MSDQQMPNWQPTGLIEGAFEIASHEHRDCVRKGTSIPYISHLLAVSAFVIGTWRQRGSSGCGASA